MKPSRSLMFVVVLLCAAVASAQRVTAVYAPLSADFQTVHEDPPMYGAAVYHIGPPSNGVLGMFAHGNSFGHAPGDTTLDQLYRWRRAAGGSWATQYGGLTPSMYQQTDPTLDENDPRATILPGAHPDFREPSNLPAQVCGNVAANPTGIFGVPETAVVGDKLFMAYLKGNADGYTGEVHWAVSSDWGATWDKKSEALLWAPNHRGHRADGTLGCSEGIGEFAMVITTDPATGQKWFNIYGSWNHPAREVTNYDWSTVHYRIKYSSTNTYGLDLTSGQLWYNNAWLSHNGKLYWQHDGTPPAGNPALDRTKVKAKWDNFGSYRNIRLATSATSKTYSATSFGYWMIVEGYYPDQPWTWNNHLILSSDDGLNWSQPTPIDVTAIRNIYGSTPALVHNSIFYGTVSGITDFWGFFSLGNQCPSRQNGGGVYCGTRILPTRLEIPEWK